ncbi:hypothetical protein Zmor_024216 [Zophobas morio]|uniref:CRAL-TRIO domain-containing protein n=1 Tax=Zophobas morio TaxID=2755281 RepID=A0AA38HZS9_9CUCU|nr:hypothetical protein Zmor_024216 [Zophobas morio]
MESLLVVTSEDKKQILKYYNVTENNIKEDVAIIQTWKEKQPHLPPTLSDDFIEKILLRNKCRVERTKQKLDNYYSLRGHNKNLIRDFESIVPSKHVTIYLPMPNLTPNLERIVIMKIMNPSPIAYDIYEVIKVNLGIEELSLQHDYSVGIRYLFDFSGFTLNHLLRINPLPLGKHINLIEKAYSQRILGLELINFPSFANKILALMKLVLRPKIYERVRIHENMESVYKVIPKECLPFDYGGTLTPIAEQLKKWDQAIEDHHDFFVENYNNVSMEHLRPLESKPNECFGVDGTFKNLAID